MARKYIPYGELKTGYYKPKGTFGTHHCEVVAHDDHLTIFGHGFERSRVKLWPGDTLGYDQGKVWRVPSPSSYSCPVRRWLAERKLPQHIVKNGKACVVAGSIYRDWEYHGVYIEYPVVTKISFSTPEERELVLEWLKKIEERGRIRYSDSPEKQEIFHEIFPRGYTIPEGDRWSKYDPNHERQAAFGPPAKSPYFFKGQEILRSQDLNEVVWGFRRAFAEKNWDLLKCLYAAVWISNQTAAVKAFMAYTKSKDPPRNLGGAIEELEPVWDISQTGPYSAIAEATGLSGR